MKRKGSEGGEGEHEDRGERAGEDTDGDMIAYDFTGTVIKGYGNAEEQEKMDFTNTGNDRTLIPQTGRCYRRPEEGATPL